MPKSRITSSLLKLKTYCPYGLLILLSGTFDSGYVSTAHAGFTHFTCVFGTCETGRECVANLPMHPEYTLYKDN